MIKILVTDSFTDELEKLYSVAAQHALCARARDVTDLWAIERGISSLVTRWVGRKCIGIPAILIVREDFGAHPKTNFRRALEEFLQNRPEVVTINTPEEFSEFFGGLE